MPRIQWRRFADESQVRDVLLGELPLGKCVVADMAR